MTTTLCDQCRADRVRWRVCFEAYCGPSSWCCAFCATVLIFAGLSVSHLQEVRS